MKTFWQPHSRASGRYPVGTIAVYGPHSTLATKLVVSVLDRESVVAYFRWLAREVLEREPSQVWNSLAADSADIEALPVFAELRRANDEGLIERQFMHPSELDEVEAASPGCLLERTREQHPPIDDIVDATASWGCFANERASAARAEPYKASPKVGRNEPCPLRQRQKVQEVLRRLSSRNDRSGHVLPVSRHRAERS